MSEAEGQLDLLALLPTREEQHPTPPRLTASPARGYAAREVAYAEWKQRHGGFDCDRVSHGWHAALCEATGPVTHCQATVLTANLRCACSRGCHCVGDLYYRGACLHCPWEGPVREEQTETVGDGLDHAHLGWRNSPTVAPLGHEPSPKQRRRWNEEVDKRYGERPEGYPIITERTAPGTRAVPGRSPWRGLRRGCVHRPRHPRARRLTRTLRNTRNTCTHVLRVLRVTVRADQRGAKPSDDFPLSTPRTQG